jgi:hypothetical protein
MMSDIRLSGIWVWLLFLVLSSIITGVIDGLMGIRRPPFRSKYFASDIIHTIMDAFLGMVLYLVLTGAI